MSADATLKTKLLNSQSMAWNAGLRSSTFDIWFVFGIPAVALVNLLALMIWPESLMWILGVDLWLLGYHHVIATYTKVTLDSDSRRKYWALMLILPAIIIAGVYFIGTQGGASALTSIYFYWLWFHYVRQSEGVSKAYAASCGARNIPDQPLHRTSFYLLPTACLLQLSSNGSGVLLGIELKAFALSADAMHAIWAFTGAVGLVSINGLYKKLRAKQLSRFYFAFVCSHYAIFILTYGLVKDTTIAWLGLNIWHNLQYLTFVWLSHQRRFKAQIAPRAVLLSTLAQPKNILLYVVGCLTVTFLFYMSVDAALPILGSMLGTSPLLTAVMAYQAINFHHYIVDAVIWRKPKAPPSEKPLVDATAR